MREAGNIRSICFDCADPWALAHWWEPVLGYRVRAHTETDLTQLQEAGYAGPEEDPSIALDPPSIGAPTVWFNRVPEDKAVKNRVHLDVYGSWEDLVERGASVVRGPGVASEHWVVLADPEGNEFCVFPGEA